MVVSADLRVSLGEENFLTEALAARDEGRRFNLEEKRLLAPVLCEVWNERREFNREEAGIISLQDNLFRWGHYPDSEAFALRSEAAGQILGEIRGRDSYVAANLETPDDVLALRAILDDLGMRRVVVGTMYFPYQRGDRNEAREEGWEELVLLKRLIGDIHHSGVRGMVVFDSHSPAFGWYCLRKGIAVLDVSVMPKLVAVARGRGFLEGERRIAIGGDGGARETAYLVKDLADCDDVVCGDKFKAGGETRVEFTQEDLQKVRGAVAVMGEDIISTGGTLRAVYDQLHEAGAVRVVVLATHPIFAGRAVENLGNQDGLEMVVAEGRRPLNDISQAKNITFVPTRRLIGDILELDRRGIDFWSDEGRNELLNLGLCLSAWQNYCFKLP